MIDFKKLIDETQFIEFKYWFLPSSRMSWTVMKLEDRSVLGQIVDDDQSIEEALSNSNSENEELKEVCEEFKKFRSRPEYLVVGSRLEGKSLKEIYESFIVSAYLLRIVRTSRENPDDHIDKALAILNWLNSTDFYSAPASTIYHESYVGGLNSHSVNVAMQVINLAECYAFKSVPLDSAVLCACVHDWCKIGMYEMYTKNVKDEESGQWSQVNAFRTRSRRQFVCGHGVSSAMLAREFIKLTQDEYLAIRWHQGRWNVCREELNELQQANETYPIVHMLQFADQLAITDYAK